jgi:lysophospholipase L1-like esterase
VTPSDWRARRRTPALALLAGMVVLVASCGGDDPPDRPAPAAASTEATSDATSTTAVEDLGTVEEEFVGEGATVVVVGDSLTVSSRDELREALDGRAVKMAAMRGEGLAGGPFSERWDQQIMVEALERYAADQPDVLVFALGTNDAWQSDLTPEEFDAGWARMLDLYPDTCLVGVTVTEDAPAADGFRPAEAARINGHIRADADVVVDWAAEGAGSDHTDPSDTIHLTDEGRRHRSALIAEGVDACGTLTGA